MLKKRSAQEIVPEHSVLLDSTPAELDATTTQVIKKPSEGGSPVRVAICMSKIMDMIYANSQCASIYFQMFCMREPRHMTPRQRRQSSQNNLFALKELAEGSDTASTPEVRTVAGEYMYVEMAHYTDDDKVVLICVTEYDSFTVHEYKLEKLNEKNWQYIIERFCSGNSSDQILNNVETLFASLEFKILVSNIYEQICAVKHTQPSSKFVSPGTSVMH